MACAAGPDISESGLVLALDAANKKSYSQNEFQYSTDIVTFSGTGGNAATITRDTISSPVGNTPLKMVVTGNDPYVSSMYNTPSDNIAPAANGQTWIVSVYIKASVATTGAIFILGAAADGNVFDAVTGQIAAGGVSIGTDWTRVSYAFTFTKGISFIQVRLDGPETGGTGQTVWWDGLQVERVPSGTTTPTPFTSSYYGGSVFKDLIGSNTGTLVNYPTYSGSNGGSFVFDGSNDFVQCTGSITTTAATFIVWIRRNGNQDQYDGIFLSRGTTTTGLNFQSSNQLGYHWNDDINTYSWASGLTIPNLEWSMCAVSVTSSSATAYLCQSSGITSATNTVSHSSTTLDDIKIAQDDFGGRFFNGNIAQVSIYNRALTAAEIQQNFNATRSRYSI